MSLIMTFYSPMYGLYGTDRMVHVVRSSILIAVGLARSDVWVCCDLVGIGRRNQKCVKGGSCKYSFPKMTGSLLTRQYTTRHGLVHDLLQRDKLARCGSHAMDGRQLGGIHTR